MRVANFISINLKINELFWLCKDIQYEVVQGYIIDAKRTKKSENIAFHSGHKESGHLRLNIISNQLN